MSKMTVLSRIDATGNDMCGFFRTFGHEPQGTFQEFSFRPQDGLCPRGGSVLSGTYDCQPAQDRGHGAFAAALTPLPKILSAENAVYFTFGDGCAVAAPGAESIEDRDNE